MSENHSIHLATDHNMHETTDSYHLTLGNEPANKRFDCLFTTSGVQLVRYANDGVVEFQHRLTPPEAERLVAGWLHYKGTHPQGTLQQRQPKQALGH